MATHDGQNWFGSRQILVGIPANFLECKNMSTATPSGSHEPENDGRPAIGGLSWEGAKRGEAVSFSWFFHPDNFHFSTRAIEPVEAIFFYGTLLREECEIDHETR